MLCPALEPLRGDERFDKIATAARPRFDAMLTILEEARERHELPAYLEQPLAGLLADLGMSPRG